MTSKSKILLSRGCPRSNIPRVEAQNESLPCDKLLVRYVHEFQAYRIMREEFLKRKEYTHMVLATDDIVVRAEHITQLQRNIDDHPDNPVISGMMNVNQRDEVHVNLTDVLPSKERRGRTYEWYRREFLPKQNIFEVAFSGFPLMAIHRDIIQDYVFAGDKIFQGLPIHRGASLDLVFCWYCKDNNIKIMADKRIDMEHLRTSGEMQVNKKNPEVIFWKYGKDQMKL